MLFVITWRERPDRTRQFLMSSEPPSSDDGIFDDYPDVDSKSCRLLGPTALIVQGLLGILVILSLVSPFGGVADVHHSSKYQVYKRHRESPKRPWRIWLFDVAKQLCGQIFVHGISSSARLVSITLLTSSQTCLFPTSSLVYLRGTVVCSTSLISS